MSDEESMPRDFGWRYVGWFLWSNAISLLSTAQGTFAALALASDMFSARTLKVFLVTNAILCVVISQIKRNNPPGPPPLKQQQEKTS